MKVLVVEDERKMAAFLERAFREQSFEAEVCRQGDTAFDRIMETAFDAVVLDIMLPGLDGLAVVRRLRERGNHTPVLMLSARGQVEERVAGLEAGADDYLAKPFAIQEAVPLFFLAAGGWWLCVRALRPLVTLTHSVSRIRAANLTERIPLRGAGDELDQLTAVFNDMTARLAASFERVREFTLHASHELKTPLAILRADFGELVDEPGRSEADRARFAAHLDEVERLARIVDSLTLLTKADAHLLALDCTEVHLDELVREAAEDARALGESRRLRVVCEAAPVAIRGDRHRLRQLLLILCDNAAKYNRDDGEIALTLAPDATLRVRNTGPGIPPAEQPHVFQRFYRGAAAPAADIEGSGLGLPIAQWIAHAHGGTLAFTSDSAHTEFICTLPASSAP